MLSFDDLVEMVARPHHLPSLRKDGAIEQPAAMPEGFLQPRLDEDERSNPGIPQVILLKAPAAVGKSFTARALSSVTGNPMWDLAKFRVGSNFFTGTLAQHYGGAGYAAIEEMLHSGGVTLILDAADEALVGAGSSNFEAAVIDLCDLIGESPSSAACAVILGRPETLLQTAVLLEEHNVRWAMYNVAYFDRDQSREFVLGKIGSPSGGLREDTTQFVDSFFGAVEQALAAEIDDLGSEQFLGYAPVLDAIAAFYNDQDNPFATFEAIRTSGSSEYAWDLLVDVVNAICKRESEKLAGALGQNDPRLAQMAATAYSREQQIKLLIANDADIESVELAGDWTAEEERRFDAGWRAQFAEHPFLASQARRAEVENPLGRFSSVIFRDYAAAVAVHQLSEVESLLVLESLQRPEAQPSPMFARFLAAVAVRDDARTHSAELLPCLLDSVQSAGSSLFLSISEEADSGGDNEEIQLRVELLDVARETVDFSIERRRGTVNFGRAVGRVFCSVPSSDIVISGAHRDFLFGDFAFIRARSIECNADDVRVSVSGEGRVAIRVETFKSTTKRVVAPFNESIAITATKSELRYPWHRFKSSRKMTQGMNHTRADVTEAAMELRKLASWFLRPSLTGRGTYPVAAMDTILSKGRAPQEMFDFCLESGVIVRQLPSYKFIEPAPALAIKQLDLDNPQLDSFLRSYLDGQ
jgi:hypothetical protein